MASKVRSICFRKFYRLTPKIYHCAVFAPLFAVKKWYKYKTTMQIKTLTQSKSRTDEFYRMTPKTEW